MTDPDADRAKAIEPRDAITAVRLLNALGVAMGEESIGMVMVALTGTRAAVDRQAREYAADAIRWAAEGVKMPYDVRMDLQARADWVRAGHQFE